MGGSATLFSQHYILQDDGQKKSVLEQTADGQTVFTTWTYDGDGRLRVEARDVGNDALNSVAGDQILTFGYDLSGNRRTQVVDKPNRLVGKGDDPIPQFPPRRRQPYIVRVQLQENQGTGSGRTLGVPLA